MSHRRRERVVVLGASGLIGHEICDHLDLAGHDVLAVARRFATGRRVGPFRTREVGFVDLAPHELEAFLASERPSVVVNCTGILQDGPQGSSARVHEGFVDRLARTCRKAGILLVHLSVPGVATEDPTPFSIDKRKGEAAIARSGVAHVVLRPGFVLGRNAYGGSSLLRSLAVSPVSLPKRERSAPMAVTAMTDLCRTVEAIVGLDPSTRAGLAETWDVMEMHPGTVGSVVDLLAGHLGFRGRRLPLPRWTLACGAAAGDLLATMGWRPPVRTNALDELRRGVAGDPGAWMLATGMRPLSAEETIRRLGASIQDGWYSRLYLLKGLLAGGLALYWLLVGAVTLAFGVQDAASLLVEVGMERAFAVLVVLATCLADMAIGVGIAWRRWHRNALRVSVVASLGYLVGITAIAPGLWLDPLGPLVKILPVLLTTFVAMAIEDDR